MNTSSVTARPSADMEAGAGVIHLGTRTDGEPYHYPLDGVANFGITLVGSSGSGKTHLIRQLVCGFYEHGITTFIIDPHGDLEDIPGVPREKMNTVRCAYDGTGGTINPLRVYPETGPYIAAEAFLDAIASLLPRVGNRQISLLRKLLQQSFHDAGLFEDDPATWSRRSPTIDDVLTLGEQWLEVIRNPAKPKQDDPDDDVAGMGDEPPSGDPAATGNPEPTGSHANAAPAAEGDEALLDQDDVLPKNLSINQVRMESALEILEDLQRSKLFGEDSMTIRQGCVNRFDVFSLGLAHLGLLSYLLIDRALNYAMRTAPTLDPVRPRIILVLDEGKLVKRVSTGLLSPLNRSASEGRKYGLGVVTGVQRASHLTEDVKDNSSLVVLLRQNPHNVKETARRFNVEAAALSRITPRRDGLFTLDQTGYQRVAIRSQ